MQAHFIPGMIAGTTAVIGFDTNYPDRVLDLTPVTSSRVAAVGYAGEQQLLFVAFPNGGVYEYSGVDPLVHEEMLEAESIGVFFNTHITGKRGTPALHPYRRVEEASAVNPQMGDRTAQATTDGAGLSASRITGTTTAIEGEVIRATDTIPDLPADDKDLKERALAVKAQAVALIISSGEVYAQADNRLKTIRAERALVAARMKRVYDPAYKTYIEARALRDDADAPYAAAEEAIKRSMLNYHNAEQARVREAERLERKRLEEQATAEAAERSRAEADREAQHAEAQGEPELAQSIRANPLPIAPVPVPPVVIAKDIPQPKGSASRREKWTYRIVDESAIPLTHDYYTLDLKKIGRRATDLKGNANIPGVEVYDEGTIAAGR